LIQKANDSGKPVITATQMLRSMPALQERWQPKPAQKKPADSAKAVTGPR